MKRYANFDRLVDLRSWMADPVRQIINLGNSLSSAPAKKAKLKAKPKKKYGKRRKIEIEDISDGNL